MIDEIHKRATSDVLRRVIEETSGKPTTGGSAHCPLPDHPDNNRSCSVGVRDGTPVWHCHGCGTGGDIIRLVELVERVSTAEAISRLADRLQIPQSERRPSIMTDVSDYLSRINANAWTISDSINRGETPTGWTLQDVWDRQFQCDAINSDLCAAWAERRNIPLETLTTVGVVEAERAWKGHPMTVMRVPGFTRAGELGVWQDRTLPSIKRRFPDVPKWWTAKAPADWQLLGHFGAESLAGQNQHPIVWLVEGASDYLAMLHLMEHGKDRHPVIAALGANRLTEAAQHVASSAVALIVVADGDKTGTDNAIAAVADWRKLPDSEQEAAILVAPEGEDLGSLVAKHDPGKVLYALATASLEAMDSYDQRGLGIAEIKA